MKIDNGERVHRTRITVMPVLEKTVGSVHRLAKQQKYPKEGLEFRYRKGKADAVDVDTDTTNDNTGLSGDESPADSDSNDESFADSDNDPRYPDFGD